METRFGKFITGKYFPKIFWTFYILLTLFLAAKTDWAFRILAGRTLGIPFALILLAAAVLMVLLGFLHARSVKTTACTIALGAGRGAGRRTGRGNKTYRIALLSDIHLGAFVDARHAERIVQKIQEISPDMVLISGDIIDVDNAVLQDEKEMQEAGA